MQTLPKGCQPSLKSFLDNRQNTYKSSKEKTKDLDQNRQRRRYVTQRSRKKDAGRFHKESTQTRNFIARNKEQDKPFPKARIFVWKPLFCDLCPRPAHSASISESQMTHQISISVPGGWWMCWSWTHRYWARVHLLWGCWAWRSWACESWTWVHLLCRGWAWKSLTWQFLAWRSLMHRCVA